MSADMEPEDVLSLVGRIVRNPRDSTLAARWFHSLHETPLLFSGILDSDGRVLDANRLSVEECGFERAQVVGRRFWSAAGEPADGPRPRRPGAGLVRPGGLDR